MRPSTSSSSLLLLIASLSSSAHAISTTECLVDNSLDLAEHSDCGNHGVVNYCLSQLVSSDPADVSSCFVDAGCSAEEAAIEARYTIDRCAELIQAGELRRRYRPVFERQAATTTFASATQTGDTFTGSDVCYTTSTVSTSSCPLTTGNKGVQTLTCFPTEVAKSACSPGKTCTMDSSGQDICMNLQNVPSTSGIIVGIVLASVCVIGFCALTFLCIRDRREQKRVNAKAEATALARAQTRKQRQRDVRQPHMKQREPSPSAGPRQDPFADQPRP
jgi:hypothetical protein